MHSLYWPHPVYKNYHIGGILLCDTCWLVSLERCEWSKSTVASGFQPEALKLKLSSPIYYSQLHVYIYSYVCIRMSISPDFVVYPCTPWNAPKPTVLKPSW